MTHSFANSVITAADLLQTALIWQRDGHKVALGSVIACWGSAPCPVGSMIAVRDDGIFVGSVSGGCVEGDVIVKALEVARSGSPAILDFGVSDQKAWQSGLACGGKITIYVESLRSATDGEFAC